MSDVERFFNENVEEKRPQRGYDSFVAPHNKHTYQIDLTFFSASDFDEKQKYSIALTCVDVLSQYAVAIPIRSREAPDLIAGAMEAINKMGGKPKLIFTDDEGAIGGNLFKEYVEGENMELHRSRGRPVFVERFNRTLKDMIFKRVGADEKKNKRSVQLVDYLPEFFLTYNNKNIHSATGLTPNDARKKDNELKAKPNVSIQAKRKEISRIRCR